MSSSSSRLARATERPGSQEQPKRPRRGPASGARAHAVPSPADPRPTMPPMAPQKSRSTGCAAPAIPAGREDAERKPARQPPVGGGDAERGPKPFGCRRRPSMTMRTMMMAMIASHCPSSVLTASSTSHSLNVKGCVASPPDSCREIVLGTTAARTRERRSLSRAVKPAPRAPRGQPDLAHDHHVARTADRDSSRPPNGDAESERARSRARLPPR